MGTWYLCQEAVHSCPREALRLMKYRREALRSSKRTASPRLVGYAIPSHSWCSSTTVEVPLSPSQPEPPVSSPQRFTHLRHPQAGDTVLYLVRHGQTAANHQRLLQGSSDHPLDELGLRQAGLIAQRLTEVQPIDAVVSSPLQRALVTATIIGERLALKPRIIPDLAELDFGEGENRTFEEMAAKHPEIAARYVDPNDTEVSWPGGESRGAFCARVWRAFTALLDDYRLHRVVVVAHGGVLGAFLAMVEGASPYDLARYDIRNCSLTELRVSAEHTVVQLRNDVCHLDSHLAPTAAADSQ